MEDILLVSNSCSEAQDKKSHPHNFNTLSIKARAGINCCQTVEGADKFLRVKTS